MLGFNMKVAAIVGLTLALAGFFMLVTQFDTLQTALSGVATGQQAEFVNLLTILLVVIGGIALAVGFVIAALKFVRE